MKPGRLIVNVYGRKIYLHIVSGMILAFGMTAAQFTATWHLGMIIDAVGSGYEETLSHSCAIIAAFFLSVVCSSGFTLFGSRIAAELSRILRGKTGEKICSAQFQAIERREDGELLAITDREIESVKKWLITLMKAGGLPANPGFSIAWMLCCCDWKFTLAIFWLIPLNVVTSVLIAGRLADCYDREKKAWGGVLSLFTATTQFVMMIKAYGLESLFGQKNKDGLGRYLKAVKRRMICEKLTQEYGRSSGHVTRILILLLGAYFICHGRMTVGKLTDVILLADLVGEGLSLLGDIPVCLQEARAGVLRIQSLLDMPDEKEEKADALCNQRPLDVASAREPETEYRSAPSPVKTPVFRVEGLSFSYGQECPEKSSIEREQVLSGVEFQVNMGEKIAIAGPSGCGKTTLFKLLGGLYVPQQGQIFFRGVDMAGLSSSFLRREITAGTQEAFLFQASVQENIRVAKREADREEIVAACRSAQIDSFIRTLARGYDTEMNTTVSPISNGQMQRINLARAFLRDTPVLLLDEPVSALDVETAGRVWENLFSVCGDKTILVVLHDLEEIYRFDRVLVLDKGTVAGFGTHEELMEECGLYRQLCREDGVLKEGRRTGGFI